jgi:hypothetical protein
VTPFPSFPLNGEGESSVFMKRETKKPLDLDKALNGIMMSLIIVRPQGGSNVRFSNDACEGP